MEVFENVLTRGCLMACDNIILNLPCFNYKILSSVIVLYCLSSTPHEVGGVLKDSFIIIPLIS